MEPKKPMVSLGDLWAEKPWVAAPAWEMPAMANGLEGLGDFAVGFKLVMKPRPKRKDKKNNEEEKASLSYSPILKLAHLLASTLYESLSLKH